MKRYYLVVFVGLVLLFRSHWNITSAYQYYKTSNVFFCQFRSSNCFNTSVLCQLNSNSNNSLDEEPIAINKSGEEESRQSEFYQKELAGLFNIVNHDFGDENYVNKNNESDNCLKGGQLVARTVVKLE
ncbi:MAG: hypothetical protein ABIK61_06295 [candidate division WOR-3 bacterium]